MIAKTTKKATTKKATTKKANEVVAETPIVETQVVELVVPKTPKKAPTVQSEKRSIAIGESWANPITARDRGVRDKVTVNGVQYNSVADAFRKLDLPMSNHIKFRMSVKTARHGDFVHKGTTYHFEMI